MASVPAHSVAARTADLAEPATSLHVVAFVVASVLGHVVFAYAMPDQSPRAPLPPRQQAILLPFEVPEPRPEPEPIVEEAAPEPEPEPEVQPEPDPVRPVRVREAEPEPEATPPEPAPEAATPSEEPPGGDPEATSDASAESGELQGTVVSTEGGLLVDRAAGSGRMGAARGTIRRGAGGSGGEGAADVPTPSIDRRALLRTWMASVQRTIGRADYTRALYRAQLEGRVVLALLIDADGRVRGVRVHESSGQPLLDDAALEQARRYDSVPPPPSELSWQPREIRLPIVYELRTRT